MLPGLTLAPLTLTGVLVLSGLAKLRDPRSTASMLEALRLPAPLRHRSVPRVLPPAELATAALLLTPWTATFAVGAALSLGLFTAFLVVVARAMTFDPRPVCACFGRVGNHPVNALTLGRNALLVLLALVTAWLAGAGEPAVAAVGRFSSGDQVWLLMAVALAVVAVLVLGGPARTAQRPGRRTDDEAPAPETDHLAEGLVPAPRGVLLSRSLDAVPLRRLTRQQPLLLVLVDCWCGTTFEAIERLPRWREHLPGLDVGLVHTHRPWDEWRLDDVAGVWWDPGGSVYAALGAGRSPAAVLVDTAGQVVDGPVSGLDAVEELVARLAGPPADARSAGDRPVGRA